VSSSGVEEPIEESSHLFCGLMPRFGGNLFVD
jgi:hypothetical protein